MNITFAQAPVEVTFTTEALEELPDRLAKMLRAERSAPLPIDQRVDPFVFYAAVRGDVVDLRGPPKEAIVGVSAIIDQRRRLSEGRCDAPCPAYIAFECGGKPVLRAATEEMHVVRLDEPMDKWPGLGL